MDRKTLLTLTGFVLLPQVSHAQSAQKSAAPKCDLVLADAPIRTALEMILKGFGKQNYVIDNHVLGMVTVRIPQQTFEEILKNTCSKNSQGLSWSSANNVTIIRAQPDALATKEKLAELFKQARPQIVEGIPCRMAGCLFSRSTSMAILEIGAPPDSDVQLVEQGKSIDLLGEKYLVEKITPQELRLVSEKKTLKIPLASLIPHA